MTPYKPKRGRSYVVDRRFPGVGRIRMATGMTTKKGFDRVERTLQKLFERGQLDVLRSIRDREISLAEVVSADMEDRLGTIGSDVVLGRTLAEAVELWLPRSAQSEATRRRYRVSMQALFDRGIVRPGTLVSDLARVDWQAHFASWDRSGADWNHIRRAVSRFLSMRLRGKSHPFRHEVLSSFPIAREPKRVPDISPELFWDIVRNVPEHVRPAYVCLVATGMRVRSEYLKCTELDLRPHTKSVRIPGSKTDDAEAVASIDAQLWPWVKQAVPSPVQYKMLRRHWKRACTAAGSPGLRLNDLRHAYAQWLSAAGVGENQIQAGMRHAHPDMTRHYSRIQHTAANSKVLAGILFPDSSRTGENEEGAKGA